jgi:TP901 family phage tail tape measure protein
MAKSQSLGNIYVSINARLAKYRAGLKKAEMMSVRTGQKMNASLSLSKARKSLVGFNAAIVALGAYGVARLTKSIITIGAEFEHSMLIVKGVTRATGKQFQQLTSLAKELGRTTEWTAQQAAGGLKFLGMAGLGAEKSLKALPGMLDLATAGAIELATAADIATNAMTAMQLPVEELGRVNDVFIATITRSNTNMEMMAESFKYAAPLAKAYGVSIETLAAMIGTLGNAGIQGSMAGTQLAFAFQKTRKVFEKLGMDGSGKSFVDALEAAKTAGWGANEMMSAFGMRGGRAALVLKDLIPMIKDLEHKLKNSEGEAKKLAETMRSSTRNAFIELQSAVEGIAIDAFSKDTGSLNEAVRNLTNTVRDSKSTFEDLATLLIKIAGAFVAVGEGAINTYKFLSIAESYGEYNQAIKQVLDDLKKDPRTGDYPGAIDARSVLSEHERRRLGLAVEDEESRKRGPSYDSRAMLTDLWATGKSTPRFNAPSNPALMEFAKIAEIKKHTDIEIKKLDWELIESNHKTVMALTDNWANFYDEQTQKASEASIAKAAAVEELTRGHFDRMKELSERTAWAMQENFSNFFYD